MGQFSKKWEDLEFSDNFIFCKVMKDKNLCIRFLEILLGIKIRDISYIESEHPIQDYYDSRGIRMDVYVADSNRIFDLEMQTCDYKDLPIRARYYLGASDISVTPRRTQFNKIKETYIIFICKDDPFDLDLPCYTVNQNFLESRDTTYNDKSHKIFYNSSAYKKAENKEIRDVLEFIYELKSRSNFTKTLESSVLAAKAEPTFKDDYMYFADILEDEKEQARAAGHAEGLAAGLEEGRSAGKAEGLAEGRAEGLAEGRTAGLAEGLAEGRTAGLAEGKEKGLAEGKAEGKKLKALEGAKNLLKQNISVEIIANCLGMTIEEVTKLKAEM